MLQALIGPVTNLVGGWMKNKAEEKQAKTQSKDERDPERCQLGS